MRDRVKLALVAIFIIDPKIAKSIHPFKKQDLVFTCLLYKSFKNTVGKGEIASNKQCFLFPTAFSTLFENLPPFSSSSELSSANCFNSEESKNLSFGKRLKVISTPNSSLTLPRNCSLSQSIDPE